jgi:SP family xylose:H+ symportor-like MFS transporter
MWLFAGCCIFSYFFICRYLPETKGVSLEEMEEVVLAKRGKKAPQMLTERERYSD